MATLADSFLADFESSGDDEEESIESDEEKEEGEPEFEDPTKEEGDGDIEDLDADLEDLDEDIEDLDEDEEATKEPEGINAISTLLTDQKVLNHLEAIDKILENSEKGQAEEDGVLWNTQKDAEYDILVQSNEMATVIDNEIATIHKFVRDLYATKYQELEQLVQDPATYAQVVKIIQNETDMTVVEEELIGLVPPSVVLTISVTATTTIGKPLPPEELQKCIDGCDAVLKLEEFKVKIFTYIESRMEKLAPNLSALVGPEIAARLIATAGGLVELSKIPSCNLQVLGQQRKSLQGFSRVNQGFHMGLLLHTDLLSATPKHLRQKSIKVLAARCTLAVRMDSFKEDPTGDTGRKWLEAIWEKLKKWQEPPPPKKRKALAAPLGEIKKKRGGKRKRKEKSKYEITDLAKAKNRMTFAKPEATDDYTGEGYGMVGLAGGSGRRITQKKKNTQKLSQRLSRKTQARLHRIKGSGTKSTISGIQSSIGTFSTMQGMELVAAPKRKAPKRASGAHNFFSSTGGFFKVGN